MKRKRKNKLSSNELNWPWVDLKWPREYPVVNLILEISSKNTYAMTTFRLNVVILYMSHTVVTWGDSSMFYIRHPIISEGKHWITIFLAIFDQNAGKWKYFFPIRQNIPWSWLDITNPTAYAQHFASVTNFALQWWVTGDLEY